MSPNQSPSFESPSCPLPIQKYPSIIMGHGSGGRMTQELIRNIFLPHFSNPALLAGNDFANVFNRSGGHLAVSTDAHIVNPIFFPGGDIGCLAIAGTVNDISMSGGELLAITATFILEEGFPVKDLERIVISMAATAAEAGIPIVAGDTKVVEKGNADGIFISTTGIAWVPDGLNISGDQARPGDGVIISGTVGDHGIAVLTARGELGFESKVTSDVAPLNHLIKLVTGICPHVHVLRDPTRGGLATTLNEIAQQSKVGIAIQESMVPVNPAVQSTCELLGFDPLYVANEGKVIIIAPEPFMNSILDALRANRYGRQAAFIGMVIQDSKSRVVLKTQIGGTRLLDMMTGELLPRIC